MQMVYYANYPVEEIRGRGFYLDQECLETWKCNGKGSKFRKDGGIFVVMDI